MDEVLVSRNLFANLHDAQVAVLAGEVIVGEHRETSAGRRLDPDVPIRIKGRSRFVSRGGEKLQGALDAFSLDPFGLACADLGCSTGGFTHCLLNAGALSVSAIDVGYGQFSWELRQDERVSLFERTNVRGIDVAAVGGPFQLVVGDLSFVSLKSLMPSIALLMAPGGHAVLLVKPQFELDSSLIGEGGIVTDPALHAQALQDAVAAAVDNGLHVSEIAVSPIKGTKGNVEFLLHALREGESLQKGSTMVSPEDIQQVVRNAHESIGG